MIPKLGDWDSFLTMFSHFLVLFVALYQCFFGDTDLFP